MDFMKNNGNKILFVCTGNTCRSPMAEGFFNFFAGEKKIDARATSAGIAAIDGEPASENAVIASKMSGVDISAHRSRGIDKETVDSADRIYTMTRHHAEVLTACFPEAEEKISVLGNGISDPYGGNLDVYIQCAEQIKKAVQALFDDNN